MTTEPPRPDQIQANVAAALSRLRGELAPTPLPSSAGPENSTGPESTGSESEVAKSSAVHAGSQRFDASPTLSAPDPSMALSPGKPASSSADPMDMSFARMTGIKLSEQPDLLTGIGAQPLADIPVSEATHRHRRFRNRLVAGGLFVLALVGFWYWSTSGESGDATIPVITADPSPEKVKPAEEGGLDVPNQDVAILNGDNATAPTESETVLPAPEQPTTPPAPAATSEAVPTVEAADGVPSVSAPTIDAIPSVTAPTEPSATSEAAPAAPEVPAQAASAQVEPSQIASAPTATAPTVGKGSARIQLAAVRTEAAARKEWKRLQKANPDLLGKLTLHVERFNKNSSEIYYRIQAGPVGGKVAAKQLCDKLKQKNQPCVVAN